MPRPRSGWARTPPTRAARPPEGGGGGVTLTYPGLTELTSGVSYTAGAPGTITIDVPKSDVAEAGAIDNHLYQVTSSTLTYSASAEDPAGCAVLSTLCGHLFALLDSSRAHDFVPPRLLVKGHAHTDFSGNGKPGMGDLHLWLWCRTIPETPLLPPASWLGSRTSEPTRRALRPQALRV